ncbi:MAG TPA: CGNR zinc finger domain-containing protein [Pseudonocardiaceae bacterium]|nr:CGNR zinc finger domain-containing protein [Pseudonocardiaceae bacterium]
MEFDSHTSGVVAATVNSVNVVTAGDQRGRPYRPPTGPDLVDQLTEALGSGELRGRRRPSDLQVAELSAYLGDLRAVFELRTAGDLDGACRRVNDLLSVTGAIPVLSQHDGERWHLHFHAPEAPWALGWAGSMATSLAIVLGGPSHDRLGVCSAPVCDRVYVDVSRNGTRRFCSTACQNRVKAAAFRERQKAGS